MADLDTNSWVPSETIQHPCISCGNFPAGAIKLSSATSFILFWRRSYFEAVLCPVCAEAMYIHFQSKNGRLGWWSPISFFYTLFSIFRNKIQINTHRKNFPWVVVEDKKLSRPIFRIRRDLVTVIISLLVFGLLASISLIWARDIFNQATRDEMGVIVQQGQISSFDLKIGDCINDVPDILDDNEFSVSQFVAVPCADSHQAEVYATTQIYSFSEFRKTDIINEAEKFCDAKFLPFVGRKYEDSKLEEYYLFPSEQSWLEADDRKITCLITEPTGSAKGSLRNARR